MNWEQAKIAIAVLCFFMIASIISGLFTPRSNSVHDANGNVALPKYWETGKN